MIQLILTDIEGTTTSVSFVYETLFPYFTEHIGSLIALKNTNLEVENCFENIKSVVKEEEGKIIDDQQVLEQLLYWVKTDRKETNLKKLQGIVWNEGYKNGTIKGHVYPDILPSLKLWKGTNVLLAVYSSGSVEAQKLIFGYSEFGDLTPYFTSYFDTNVGHKREASSYKNIAQHLQISPEQILFLSDIEEELDAALEAGYKTTQLVRVGTKPSEKHNKVSTFTEINLKNY